MSSREKQLKKSGLIQTFLYGTRIFLDYDSCELTGAQARYETEVDWVHSSPTDKIDIECGLSFHFGNKVVVIARFANHKEMTLEDALLKIVNNQINHAYSLVFRDGKVHNVHLTKEMVAAPRTYVYSRGRSSLSFANIALPLKMNPKPYIFRLPEQAPYELGDRNSCSQLTFHPGQSGITSIEGNGGNYLVHLCKRMILRLSTPGGFANAVHRLDYSPHGTWMPMRWAASTSNCKERSCIWGLPLFMCLNMAAMILWTRCPSSVRTGSFIRST